MPINERARLAKKKRKDEKPFRDAGIIAASFQGKTQEEIADEFNCERRTVGRVLNSDEAKRLTEVARAGLQGLLTEAVDTLQDALANRHEDMKTAVVAAIQILKGAGVLTEKVEHGVMRPFIMKLVDGGEIVMGHKPETSED